MNWQDLFRVKPQTAQPAAPAAPAQPAPATAQPAGQPATPATPAPTFADMLKPVAPAASTPIFGFGQKELQERVSSMDFSKMIPADLQLKINQGDAAAMMQATNLMMQNLMGGVLSASQQMIEHAVTNATQSMSDSIKQQITSSKIEEDLVSSQPWAQGILQPILQNIKASNPNASPEEIKKLADTALNQFADQVSTFKSGKPSQSNSGLPNTQPAASQGNIPSWDSFLGIAAPNSQSGPEQQSLPNM